MTDPHISYTCSKTLECAYARSHIAQIDNFVCQRCIDHSLWSPLGAYLYCIKHFSGPVYFPDPFIVATARNLVAQGKQFTIDGDIIEDKVVTG